MKKIVIGGGGIAGLTARYFLSKKYPQAEIVLYEKSGRLGGVIETLQTPYFFEKGPRTFKASRCPTLLNLIRDLGLEGEIIRSNPAASKRYLLKGGKLSSLNFLALSMTLSLLKEWKQPVKEGDETIQAFATRRLGADVTKNLIDPLTLGIFGGKIEELSISACFPTLKAMESEYGSLTKAFIKKKKGKKAKGLFTLKRGMESLITALKEKGRGEIFLNTPMPLLEGDLNVLAMPPAEAQKIFKEEQSTQFFQEIGSATLTVVNVAFPPGALKQEGFGYLIPSSEKEDVLGVVFDSSIFPEQSMAGETRLSIMLRKGGIKEALAALEAHLKITATPLFTAIHHYPKAIPQFHVGHLERLTQFNAACREAYPHIRCIGNYLQGVSLEATILSATQLP
ncbi:MAG: protoporphyrinogen oxidase [Chlamydiia bacterium]|nr:protoporphyrinogen oxidase [Chlamydiia bacterium]